MMIMIDDDDDDRNDDDFCDWNKAHATILKMGGGAYSRGC